ncbi:hypothetical protein H4R20_002460, partial [Coemansia guatemalensis]
LVDSGIYCCLCWNDDGDGVVITSKDSIVDIVLPNHFNTREFASFTRQFHIYGFRRVTDNRKAKHSAGHCEFTHPWFKRGKYDLLHRIVRSAPKKCPPSNPAPVVGDGSLSQRIGILAINEPAPIHDCEPMAAVAYDISPRIAPTTNVVDDIKPQIEATTSECSEMPVTSNDGCISAEDIAANEPPTAVDVSKLVESPNSKNACCALQTLTDIHENLDPKVLEFVRNKLGYLVRSIDGILQNNAVSPMPLPCENVAPISAPATTVVHTTPEVNPHATATAVNPTLYTRTLSMGNPMPTLSLPTTAMTANIPRLPMQPAMAPQAPVLSGNVFGSVNSYSVTPTSFSTHSTSSPMCSSMESSPYVPVTTATTPITVGPIAGGFPLLYPPSVAPEHMQPQSFGMNCLQIYSPLPFEGVATAPPTAGGRFSEHIN